MLMADSFVCIDCSKHIIVHRDLKPANLMLGGIPHDTGTREMAAKVRLELLYERGQA